MIPGSYSVKISLSMKETSQSPRKNCTITAGRAKPIAIPFVNCGTAVRMIPPDQCQWHNLWERHLLLRRGKCDPSEAKVSALPRGYLTVVSMPVIRECEFSQLNVTVILLSFSLKIFLELDICVFFTSSPFLPVVHAGHLTAMPKLLQKLLCNQHAWLTMKVSSLLKTLNSVISEDPHQIHGMQTMNCVYSDTDTVLPLAGTHRSVNHLDSVQCHSGEFCRILDP